MSYAIVFTSYCDYIMNSKYTHCSRDKRQRERDSVWAEAESN